MSDHAKIAWADRTGSGMARPQAELLRLNPVCWQRLEIERGADLFSSLHKMEAIA